VEHLADIVENANRFRRRWGWFPMEGWLAAFEARGLARPDPRSGTWTTDVTPRARVGGGG
jgi:hypothetical protein